MYIKRSSLFANWDSIIILTSGTLPKFKQGCTQKTGIVSCDSDSCNVRFQILTGDKSPNEWVENSVVFQSRHTFYVEYRNLSVRLQSLLTQGFQTHLIFNSYQGWKRLRLLMIIGARMSPESVMKNIQYIKIICICTYVYMYIKIF